MAVAVISEFNPFHNGHKYLLETVKKLTNSSVIAVMSGSFTQRGEVAICDKFSRAKAALQNGADLVVELPVVYSLANAQRFSSAGVDIAKSFDCTQYLAFGCETADSKLLRGAVNAVKNSEVQSFVRKEMKNGDYYPRALENAVRNIIGDDVADVLSKPNNILAVEYLKCLGESDIIPLPIQRIGAEHDSEQSSADIASASFIRKLVRSGKSDEAINYVPSTFGDITYPQNLENATLYKLRSMTAEDFARLPDVAEGLENRIIASVNKYNSVKEIIDSVKTKRYTHARLRRIIACALLGITEEMQNLPIEYVRVLGFTDNGAELLKHCRKNVVTSVSKGLMLGENTKKLLNMDIYANDIAALAYSTPKEKGSDFTTQVVKIK